MTINSPSNTLIIRPAAAVNVDHLIKAVRSGDVGLRLNYDILRALVN